MQNLKFLALIANIIIRGGPEITKVGHVTPHNHFWYDIAFFISTHCRPSLCHCGDISGPKIPKSGSRDLFLHFPCQFSCQPFLC